MALNYTITPTAVTVTQTTQSVRLHHGGLTEGIFSIVKYGLNQEIAQAIGGTGEFWATGDPLRASMFAPSAPGSGKPVLLGFDLPFVILDRCLTETPYPWVWHHEQQGDYEFLCTSYSVLNAGMTNITITYLE